MFSQLEAFQPCKYLEIEWISIHFAGIGPPPECLCIETFSGSCLGLHNAPNTLLHDLVTQLQARTKQTDNNCSCE